MKEQSEADHDQIPQSDQSLKILRLNNERSSIGAAIRCFEFKKGKLFGVKKEHE